MKVISKGVEVPVERVQPSPFQPRIEFNLEALRTSIIKDGMIGSVLVRQLGDGKFELIDGERRWRIAQELGMPTITCDIVEADDATTRRLVWTLNAEHKDYTPKEKAYHFKRMHEQYGMSLREIAEEFNTNPHVVIACLNVFKLPEKYQQTIWGEGEKKQKLTISHIQALESLFANNTPISAIIELLDYAMENDLSVAEFRSYLKEVEGKQIEAVEAKVKEVVQAPEVKLETHEELEKAAELLKRKAEELKSPEVLFKEKVEKAKKAVSEVKPRIDEAEALGVDVTAFKTALDYLVTEAEQHPDEVLKNAQELKRKVSDAVSEAKQRRGVVEKVQKLASKVKPRLSEAKSLGVDTAGFEESLRNIEGTLNEQPDIALKTLETLSQEIKAAVRAVEEDKRKREAEEHEKALREKIQKEVAEDVAKRTMDELLSKPSFVQEAQVKVQMDYLRGRFPELEQWRDVLPEKSLRVIAEALAKKGAQKWEIRLPFIIEDLGKLVDKCRKLGWKVRPKDVKKILRDRGALKTPLTEEDKELQSAQMFVPWPLVELVWNNTPWKTKRAPVLKKTIDMMYKNLGAERVEKLFRTALQMNAPPGYFVKERHVW